MERVICRSELYVTTAKGGGQYIILVRTLRLALIIAWQHIFQTTLHTGRMVGSIVLYSMLYKLLLIQLVISTRGIAMYFLVLYWYVLIWATG